MNLVYSPMLLYKFIRVKYKLSKYNIPEHFVKITLTLSYKPIL